MRIQDVQPVRKYRIIVEDEAQEWLDQQSEDVRNRVLLILDTFSEIAPVAGKQLQNATRWYDDIYGWARRIALDSVILGLRCIYYIWQEKRQMIIVKFGTHDNEVYEDGN
jgi:hypothetical protein